MPGKMSGIPTKPKSGKVRLRSNKWQPTQPHCKQDGIAVDPDKVRAILEATAPSNAKALSQFLGQIRWHSRMILGGLCNTTTRNSTPIALSVGGTRGKGPSCTKSNVVTSSGGSTSGLDKKFPCVRRRFKHSNWECLDATHLTEVVPTGVLTEL